MAASVVIRSFHGATGTTTQDIDNGAVRYKAADNDTVDAANPLVIPGAGSVYSYVKQFKYRITATPPSNSIGNFQVYTDGANGLPANGSPANSCRLWIRTHATYMDPVANAQAQLVAGTPAGSPAPVDAFTLTSGSPLAVSGSGSAANTDIGDYITTQFEVTSAALQGTTNSETLTFQYDES